MLTVLPKHHLIFGMSRYFPSSHQGKNICFMYHLNNAYPCPKISRKRKRDLLIQFEYLKTFLSADCKVSLILVKTNINDLVRLFLHYQITISPFLSYINYHFIIICLLFYIQIMTEEAKVNWVSVINFLETQYSQISIREKQWKYEKEVMTQRINSLEAEIRSNLIICQNLVNRIKILEVALKEEKFSKGNTKSILDQEQIKTMIQKFKLKQSIEKDSHEEFLNDIIKDLRFDTRLYPKIQNQKQMAPNIASKHKKLSQKQKFGAHLDVVTTVVSFQFNQQQFFATSSEDCLIKIWSIPDVLKQDCPQPKNTLRKHTGPLFSLTSCKNPANMNENLLFSGGIEGDIKSWVQQSSGVKWTGSWLNGNEEEQTIWQLQACQNKLLSSSSDGIVRLFTIGETQQVQLSAPKQFKQKQFSHAAIKWISNNLFLAGCSNAPRIHLWNIQGKQTSKFIYEIQKFKQVGSMMVNCLQIDKQRKFIIGGCQDGIARLFDINTSKIIKKLSTKASISSVVSWDWQILASDHKGNISFFDSRTFNLIQCKENVHLQKYDTGITCMTKSKDYLLTCGADGIVKIFQ